MKISHAIEQFQQGVLDSIEIRRSPGNRYQWFVVIKSNQGKTYFLADHDDNTIAEESLEKLFSMLKQIGFKDAQIFF